jgi:hypothetical protein
VGFANRFQLVLFGARQRLGLLEGLFAGELFRPKGAGPDCPRNRSAGSAARPKNEAPALRHGFMLDQSDRPHDSADLPGAQIINPLECGTAASYCASWRGKYRQNVSDFAAPHPGQLLAHPAEMTSK